MTRAIRLHRYVCRTGLRSTVITSGASVSHRATNESGRLRRLHKDNLHHHVTFPGCDPKVIIFLLLKFFNVIRSTSSSASSGLGKPFSDAVSMSRDHSLILDESYSMLSSNSWQDIGTGLLHPVHFHPRHVRVVVDELLSFFDVAGWTGEHTQSSVVNSV